MMSEKQDSEDDPGHAGGDSLVVKTEGLAEKFLRIDSTEQNRSGQNNEPDPDQTERIFSISIMEGMLSKILTCFAPS